MAVHASTFRVSEFSQTSGVLAQLRQNLSALSEKQQQISSGQLYQRPSDGPLAVRRLISWDRWIDRHEKYEANISLATSRLSAAESSLDDLHEMIGRARDLGLQQINASATEETRSNAAIEISSLIDEAVTVANRQFADRYLFAGSQVKTTPFERVGEYVAYQGDELASRVEIGVRTAFEDSVTGAHAFGGMSTEIVGAEDSQPAVTTGTRLSDLNGGRGVDVGAIEIRDGLGGVATIDLSRAKTVGDVIDFVNDSGFAIAGMNATSNGIVISKGGANLDVMNVNGNRTATDLGIAVLDAGPTVIGGDIDPIVRSTTTLAQLRGGAGVDQSGITIRNGDLSAEIDFTGLETIEDMLNAINTSGTGTRAEITGDGKTLSVRSVLAGADLVIEENGGTTGRDFGWIVASEDIPLDQLNRGLGVVNGEGADFRMTASDGTTIDVEMDGASTLGDVAELINQHPDSAGRVTAVVVAGENRLRLTDIAGGAGELVVAPINGAHTAAQLGIQGAATGGVIEGADLQPGGTRLVSAFDGFALLFRSLASGDVGEIGRAIRALDDAEDKILNVRAELGGGIRRLEISARRTELERLQMRELVSKEGDTDLAEAIVLFEQHQTIYQASLQTAATLVQPSLLDFLG